MEWARHLRVPSLLFAVILFGGSTAKIMGNLPEKGGAWTIAAIAIVIGGAIIFGVAALLIYLRNERWKAEFAEEQRRRDDETQALRGQIQELEEKAVNPPLDLITSEKYGALLKQWNDSGEGEVLLYNIELQSFSDREQIASTWGGLKKLTNVKKIRLLLPSWKIDRWVEAVLSHADGFFADEDNRRFWVCEFEASETVGEGPAPVGVAFAMYRYTAGEARGSLHSTVVWFILSRPFAVLQEHYFDLAARWWDYKHILAVRDREDLRAKALAIWESVDRPERSRDVAAVIEGAKPLEPLEPEAFFERIWLPEDKKTERLAHLDLSRAKVEEHPSPIRLTEPNGDFQLRYDNGDVIVGHYEGIDVESRHERPAVVWVGGFTERHYSELWRLFERCLKREDVVRFYYEVSPGIADVTLTRYRQDMREVLRYVNRQNVILRDRIVVIARSINALIATLTAAEEDIRGMLAGVILVAPVFDVIEMMDNYRKRRGQEHVRIKEKAWRAAPGYTNGVQWEQPRTIRRDGTTQGGWLEFFGHDVGLQLIADICRYPEGTFEFEGFKEAVRRIAERCPVYVLSHPEDPITGSAGAIESLQSATQGSIVIRKENFEYVPIESKHLEPDEILKETYPFKHSEPRAVHATFKRILHRLGLPTTDIAAHTAQQTGG